MEYDYIECGDCLELMRDIPDGSIDMILCDLPYGTTKNKWDSVIPFEPLWEQYNRIIKDNGAIVLFSQMPFTVDLVASNYKDFRYEWIWEKLSASGHLNANRMPMKKHENILVLYKKNYQHIIHSLRKVNLMLQLIPHIHLIMENKKTT